MNLGVGFTTIMMLMVTAMPPSISAPSLDLDGEPFYHPLCTVAPHLRVLYVVPDGAESYYEDNVSAVRAAVNDSNTLLHESSLAQVNYRADLRMRCTDGLVEVTEVFVPLPAVTSYEDLSKALDSWKEDDVKLWVAYQGQSDRGVSGTAHRFDDDSPIGNVNDLGGSVAVVWDAGGKGPWLHEMLHSLGAVQHSAPHSTGRGHCWDGSDVMCYDDGGTYGESATCTKRQVDCNNDDYYHPKPAPGSYLDTHWNIANSRFLTVVPGEEACLGEELGLCSTTSAILRKVSDEAT